MVKIILLWLLCFNIVYGANSSIDKDSMSSLVCNGMAITVYSICVEGDECITDGVGSFKRINNDTPDSIVNVMSYAIAYKLPITMCTLFTSTPITYQAYSFAKNTKHSKEYYDLLERAGTITLCKENVK